MFGLKKGNRTPFNEIGKAKEGHNLKCRRQSSPASGGLGKMMVVKSHPFWDATVAQPLLCENLCS